MTTKRIFDSDRGRGESRRVDKIGRSSTQTIDFDSVLGRDVTESGSFDLRDVRSTSLGKLLEALPLSACLLDVQGEIVFRNRRWTKTIGTETKAERIRFVDLFVDGEPRTAASEAFDKAVYDGGPRTFKASVTGLDGELWFRFHLRAVRVASRKLVLLLVEDVTTEHRRLASKEQDAAELSRVKGDLEARMHERTLELEKANEKLLREISERLKTEHALRESEERYRLLTQNSVSGIFILVDGIISFANERMAEMTGVAVERLQGSSFLEFVHPDDRDTVAVITQARKQSDGSPGQFEFRLVDARGEVRWVAVLAALIHFKGQTANMGNLVDITERRRAEDELRAGEQRYRSVVEDQTELICRFRPDLSLTFANSAYCQYYDGDARSLLNTGFLDAVYEDDREMLLAALNSLSPEGPVVTCELRAIKRDGEIRWQHWTNRAIFDSQARLVEIQSVGSDITKRKMVERELEKARRELEDRVFQATVELRAANAQLMQEIGERKMAESRLLDSLHAKEILMRETHHRFKNNLQVVSSLLRLQARHAQDAALRTMLEDSELRLQSMAIVHEKLHRSGDQETVDFPSYMTNLTSNLLQSLAIDPARIKFHNHSEPVQLGVEVAVPCGLIAHELLSNSLKHAFPDDRSGSIEFSLRRFNDNTLSMVIRDDGVGISEDFSIDHEDSVGFMLVRRLVKQIRGKIEIERKNGTTFTVTFPALR